jgi:tetraacyldisaccharide 4'-kinase
VVLTRSDGVSEATLRALQERIRGWAPGVLQVAAVHRAVGLLDPGGARQPLEALKGQAVRLISGIGNPAAFERSARGAGMKVEQHRIFADHHDYDAQDLAWLKDSSGAAQELPLLTTAKDWAKLKGLVPAGTTWVLLVEMELLAGREAFLELLDSLHLEDRAEQRAHKLDTMHAGLHG